MEFLDKIKGSYYLYKGKVRGRISRKVGRGEYGNSIKRYAGKKMLSAEEMNKFIYEGLNGDNPFMVCRFGSTELTSLSSFYFNRKAEYQSAIDHLAFSAGFFPADVSLGKRYTDIMIDACKETDALAVWFVQYEDYFVKTMLSENSKISYLMNIEPWKSSIPWTKALKGKKVLVIHPFEESIRHQYARRTLLFDNSDILPEFELKTLKAVQTINGTKDERFQNWFEALEYMYNEAMKIDFDVAIIGCGAYGMPLAAMLKGAGKKAIHMGGVTQILFGIKGKRWTESPDYAYIKDLMNENWVYPLDSEKPQNAKAVEDGCYWK